MRVRWSGLFLGSAAVLAALALGRARAVEVSGIAYAAGGSVSGWAWLQHTGSVDQLFVAKARSGAGTPVASGIGWMEVGLDPSGAWIVQRLGQRGALLRVPVQGNAPGATPETIAGDLQAPGGLFLQDGRAFWLEIAPPGGDRGYVPPAGRVARVRMRESSGQLRTLGEWPVSADTISAAPGDVVGVAGNAVYVRIRRTLTTEFVRFPLDGGPPARVVAAPGHQEGVLTGGHLAYTASSREAAPEARECSVLQQAGGPAPVLLGDWLPAGGRLLPTRNGLYYASTRLSALKAGRMPEPQAPPPPGILASDGATLFVVRPGGRPEALGGAP